MQKVQYPAVLVLARFDREAGEAIAFTDNRILSSDEDLDARLQTYRALEEMGGTVYTVTLAEVANADQVLAERVAALEFEAGLRDSPELEAAPLDRAYEAARAAFDGDAGTLSRLERALELAKSGAVRALGNGQFEVNSQSNGRTYTVNGACQCADYAWRGVPWCKHRLAVALVAKARQIEEEEAESCHSQPQEPSEEDPQQDQDTTEPDLAQVHNFMPLWGGRSGVDVAYSDGRREVLESACYDVLAARAQAMGWGCFGQGMYLNPAS
jgi:hypothetical protein